MTSIVVSPWVTTFKSPMTNNLKTTLQTPNPRYQLLQTSNTKVEEYMTNTAEVIAKTIHHYTMATEGLDQRQALSFMQTFSLKKGLKEFGRC
mmetsp:Transcript_26523/g.37642  ORF Transcript_26523/g.37642 Transcript_26523/m.37642 type:complete len:92 (+) Transcript_26523:64-339(+)